MAGCAQQRTEGYYNPPAASTVTDAQAQAQAANYRTVFNAPSQLQIELKPRQPGRQQAVQQATASNEQGVTAPSYDGAESADAAAPATASTAARELIPQAQTYQGTLPCLHADMNCTAQLVTLTLAPSGQWRARISYLNGHPNAGKPAFEQGCWSALHERPPRVLLMEANGNVRADFTVPANNTLRVRAVNGHMPNLNYTLTRQPDLNPVSELDKQPAPHCGQ
ncbi:hypothetical protein D557_1170 [Bordetella holmesii 70147]|nr:hypothetical protein D558_1906 [Bordetella holmesii 44057]EWM51317.1 hypothetical protein D557_1170 [Bordetella holmesii 70147]KAK85016.1 hypothetical protein L573_2715 [Bordetella holmesii H620]KAK88141.1 hypothetical protein L496_3528 [Bordetella holmesii CDC-H572-BH]KCV02145.1 hypothetical protein L501_3613 [Bordetella holmesii CDC-H719-BH]KCV11208.1 hypothetical protein AZ25_2866 [Bordetella holmesii 04P3421]